MPMDVVSTFHFTSYDIIYARSAVETLCWGQWDPRLGVHFGNLPHSKIGGMYGLCKAEPAGEDHLDMGS